MAFHNNPKRRSIDRQGREWRCHHCKQRVHAVEVEELRDETFTIEMPGFFGTLFGVIESTVLSIKGYCPACKQPCSPRGVLK